MELLIMQFPPISTKYKLEKTKLLRGQLGRTLPTSSNKSIPELKFLYVFRDHLYIHLQSTGGGLSGPQHASGIIKTSVCITITPPFFVIFSLIGQISGCPIFGLLR
jgi:hypothetical protein